PTGLRTVSTRDWFRAWVRLIYRLNEIENAARNDQDLQRRAATAAERPETRSWYRVRFALEATERLHSNVLQAALGRALDELWAGTVGICDPRRDIRELHHALDLVRASPAGQSALALPSTLSRELRRE